MGMLLPSANDASAAAAEQVAGSVQQFVACMNQEAARLGLRNTHFTNPHGLHSPEHYSSAYDLAVIAREDLRNADFARLVATKEAVIPWPGKPWARKLVNRNRLLRRWDRCDGIKTGYTKQAGRCLAASATENRWRLICVVLHCKDSWSDAEALLKWGFATYRHVRLAAQGWPVYAVEVRHGVQREVGAQPAGDLWVTVRRGERAPQAVVEARGVEAPVAVGTPVGRLTFVQGDLRQSVELVATENVRRALWARLWDARAPQLSLFFLACLAAGVLAHGARTKAARTRRRRLAARRGTTDSAGAGDGGRPPSRPGQQGRSR